MIGAQKMFAVFYEITYYGILHIEFLSLHYDSTFSSLQWTIFINLQKNYLFAIYAMYPSLGIKYG